MTFHCIFPVWGFSLVTSLWPSLKFCLLQDTLYYSEEKEIEFTWNCCQVGTLNSNQNENKRAQSWQSLCKEGIPRKNVIIIQTKPKKTKQTKPKSTYSIEMNIHQRCIKPNQTPIPVLKASQQPWSRSRSHKEQRVVPVYEDLTSISCSLVQLPNNIYLPQVVFSGLH